MLNWLRKLGVKFVLPFIIQHLYIDGSTVQTDQGKEFKLVIELKDILAGADITIYKGTFDIFDGNGKAKQIDLSALGIESDLGNLKQHIKQIKKI